MSAINKSDACTVAHAHNKVLVIIPQPHPHHINIWVIFINPCGKPIQNALFNCCMDACACAYSHLLLWYSHAHLYTSDTCFEYVM